jgi:aerobic-type carbon monoxide dehydrogenase small subunit (CoxS/CutS family)
MMVTFNLNGKQVTAPAGITLMDYLRDELQITSLKNGCGEGVCGACMVLVDGKPTRACVQKIARLEGKTVLTIEGLPQKEQDIYAWAFAEAGAVQCGFCIPGMVISAKGLLDQKLNPTPSEVKKALRNNLCRCTGYVKIEKAVMLAAQALRGEISPGELGEAKVGGRLERVDARVKTWAKQNT